jgi:hypothetical protein
MELRKERNILHKIKRKRIKWISHILRTNCLLKHVIEGKVEEISGGNREKRGSLRSY